MTTPQTRDIREIACSACGAPISHTTSETVLTCPACGGTVLLAGFDRVIRVETHRALPIRVDETAVRERARDWMSRGFFKAADLAERAVFAPARSLALPFWVVRARARTFWSGANRRTRTVDGGGTRRSETYWEPTSGEFAAEHRWTVFARQRSDEPWGLDSLDPGGRRSRADWGKFVLKLDVGTETGAADDPLANAQAFSLAGLSGTTIVHGQITQEQAERQAQREIVALHQRQAAGQADRITDCDTAVDVQGVDLVHRPLWSMQYEYRGRSYRLLIDGHGGEVLAGEAPVGKWDKVVVLAIALGPLGGILAASAILTGTAWLWWPAGACLSLLAGFTGWTALRAKG